MPTLLQTRRCVERQSILLHLWTKQKKNNILSTGVRGSKRQVHVLRFRGTQIVCWNIHVDDLRHLRPVDRQRKAPLGMVRWFRPWLNDVKNYRILRITQILISKCAGFCTSTSNSRRYNIVAFPPIQIRPSEIVSSSMGKVSWSAPMLSHPGSSSKSSHMGMLIQIMLGSWIVFGSAH